MALSVKRYADLAEGLCCNSDKCSRQPPASASAPLGIARILVPATRHWSAFSESCQDVFSGTVGRQFDGAGTGPNIEIPVRRRFHTFPLQEHRLGAPLAGNDAHGLALHHLRLWVDAGAGAAPHTVAHHLGEVTHELVIGLKSILFDANDRSVVSDADQQVAAFCVEKSGNSLQHGESYTLIVLSVLFQAPAQSGLKLQRLRLARLDQLLGVAVRAQVLIEEEVFDRLSESTVVGHALVEVEVRIDDLLDYVLDLLVEGEPHVLPRVGPGCCVKRSVVVELLHHLAESHSVLGAEVQPKALVQLGDNARKRLQLLRRDGVSLLRADGL